MDRRRDQCKPDWPARNNWGDLLLCLMVAVGFPTGVAYAQIHGAEVAPGAQGLVGITNGYAGAQLQIYSVELQDQGPGFPPIAELGNPAGNLGIRIKIFDLDVATGLQSSDIQSIALFRSSDNTIDAGDIFINSVSPVVVNASGTALGAGAFNEIDATGAAAADRLLPDGPASIFFLLQVKISPNAIAGHAFKVGATALHIGIEETGGLGFNGPIGTQLSPSDAGHIVIGGGVAQKLGGGAVTIPFGGEEFILILMLGSGVYMLRRRVA